MREPIVGPTGEEDRIHLLIRDKRNEPPIRISLSVWPNSRSEEALSWRLVRKYLRVLSLKISLADGMRPLVLLQSLANGPVLDLLYD